MRSTLFYQLVEVLHLQHRVFSEIAISMPVPEKKRTSHYWDPSSANEDGHFHLQCYWFLNRKCGGLTRNA